MRDRAKLSEQARRPGNVDAPAIEDAISSTDRKGLHLDRVCAVSHLAASMGAMSPMVLLCWGRLPEPTQGRSSKSSLSALEGRF
jgi:hypothetical protein